MSSRRQSTHHLMLGLGAALLLSASALPAAAQVGDFFCSTFSIGCEPPPPPPPAPAPVVEEPAPKKKVRHARKAVPKRTVAKADADKADAAPK